jgi:hypothetical protein
MNIDVHTGLFQENIIYLATQLLNPSYNASFLTYNQLDSVTGQVEYVIASFSTSPPYHTNTDVKQEAFMNWYPMLVFNPYVGLPQLLLQSLTPMRNQRGCYTVTIYTSMYTVSSVLRSMLTYVKDRMYLYLPGSGTMVAASHGKYFSHSDIDYTQNNPLVDPPPVKDFQTYVPTQSTDPIIQASAVWLLSRFHGWDSVPQLSDEVGLGNSSETYWITVASITSQVHSEQ